MKQYSTKIIIVAALWLTFAAAASSEEEGRFVSPSKVLSINDTYSALKMTFDNDYKDDIRVDLYGKQAPLTVENFLMLCRGVELKGKRHSIVGTQLFKIVKNFFIQSGDHDLNNGMGGLNVLGKYFTEENTQTKHQKYVLSQGGGKQDSNMSQFYIILSDQASYMNSRQTVFGRVVQGTELIEKANYYGSYSGRVTGTIVFTACRIEEKIAPNDL